ncbi:unannotated protein [freshwater metagenome]|uniref:Unannotated protein n=1 Tax=freshwater metagenome TaxID=449393 RepID=A0A6J7FV16_9ZZZZ|nr:hypothetical protein [Actinomycetota bacterium]
MVTARTATIINDVEHVEVDAVLGSRWLMQPDAFQSLTGWTLKPEGLCRGDVCAPIYHRDKVLADGLIDLQEAAPIIGLSVVTDPDRGVAALTASAPARAQEMISLQAPDFTLSNLAGEPVSLHDFNRRKVLLLAWSSW